LWQATVDDAPERMNAHDDGFDVCLPNTLLLD
jgi:hypothetical protein